MIIINIFFCYCRLHRNMSFSFIGLSDYMFLAPKNVVTYRRKLHFKGEDDNKKYKQKSRSVLCSKLLNVKLRLGLHIK